MRKLAILLLVAALWSCGKGSTTDPSANPSGAQLAGNGPGPGLLSTISWSSRPWFVRTGVGGPDGNYWSANNVWVDASGYLHLKITKSGSTWYCAEVYTTTALPYGKYQWWVNSRIDQLDKNVVFGLFSYGGVDGINEIDIEYAKWGNSSSNIGNYGAYPKVQGGGHVGATFPVSLNGSYTTQRFTWRSGSIYFQSLNGHYNDNSYQYKSWTTPSNWASKVPSISMPVHINLWLKNHTPPSNGQPVEVVVQNFTFSP